MLQNQRALKPQETLHNAWRFHPKSHGRHTWLRGNESTRTSWQFKCFFSNQTLFHSLHCDQWILGLARDNSPWIATRRNRPVRKCQELTVAQRTEIVLVKNLQCIRASHDYRSRNYQQKASFSWDDRSQGWLFNVQRWIKDHQILKVPNRLVQANHWGDHQDKHSDNPKAAVTHRKPRV